MQIIQSLSTRPLLRSCAVWLVRRSVAALLGALVALLAFQAAFAPAPSYAAIPPTSTSLPTIAGNAAVGETLTATDGTWGGDPDPTITRQWERCDLDGGSCSPIDGETDTTYTVSNDDVGTALRVAVTATNSDWIDPTIGTSSTKIGGTDTSSAPQIASEPTSDTWSLTVLSDPVDVPADQPPVVVPAPVVAAPAAVVPARTILSMAQPRVQCMALARLVEPATPGPLTATGSLSGALTIRAAGRPVLVVATSAGRVQLRAGRRVLSTADGVGGLGWTERSSRRLALLSDDGRLLIAVGRNAHHGDLTIVKSRLCTAHAPAVGHIDGRADQPVHATVYATGPDGSPLAQVPLAVSTPGLSMQVQTDAHGQAQIQLPAGGRRDLHVTFAGDATHAPATLAVPITSAATSTLSLVSGMLPARGLAEFAGRLEGRDGNPAASRITLAAQTPHGHWQTVGSTAVDQHGRWTITTTPPRVPAGTMLVAYRVDIAPGATYPYDAAVGSSTMFHVTKRASR